MKKGKFLDLIITINDTLSLKKKSLLSVFIIPELESWNFPGKVKFLQYYFPLGVSNHFMVKSMLLFLMKNWVLTVYI